MEHSEKLRNSSEKFKTQAKKLTTQAKNSKTQAKKSRIRQIHMVYLPKTRPKKAETQITSAELLLIAWHANLTSQYRILNSFTDLFLPHSLLHLFTGTH